MLYKFLILSDEVDDFMREITIDASATSIAWDKEKSGFFGNLVFELYIYNGTTNAFQYHQRYLSLWLRMTT